MVNEYAWWKGGPVASSAVLSVESLQRAYEKVTERYVTMAPSPVFYLPPKVAHYYRCVLARAYWKHAYREFRMFKRACEMGWMNGRY